MSFDKTIAAKLWNSMKIEVQKFTPKVIVREKSRFLGYADVTINRGPGDVCSYYGVGVKELKGKPHLEFPMNLIRDDQGKVTNEYPVAIPRTPELREVITVGVFQDARVQAALASAAQLAAQAAPAEESTGSATAANPFA